MNRRRREILAALAPATELALQAGAGVLYREKRDVPGLALRARVTAEAPAELLIYGPIGGGMFDGGISASDVAAILRDVGPGPINVRINSPGGDVFQGVAIHSLLARHPGTVTCYVDGLAASAASFIMLAGDHVVCARNAMIMIHDGMTGPYGNARTIRRAADLLDQVSENIADMYAERAGEDSAHWRALMTQNEEDGTWFKGPDAMSAGLVDAITETPDDDPDSMVWDRLRTWADRLPESVAKAIPDPLPDPEPDGPDDAVKPKCETCAAEIESGKMKPGTQCTHGKAEPDEDVSDENGTNFAYSMSMWAWMNMNGHAARNGVSQ